MELDADKVFTCVEEREKKHDMMLDLSLSAQKSENLFGDSDQTPTPTRLIRNCEEVGLFEDLRHVNPFEETFRRAVEQNNSDTPIRQLDSVEVHVDEDSLHTPQVYPQLEPIHSCEMLTKPLDSPSSAAVTLDVPAVDELLNAAADAYKIGTSRQNSNTSTASSNGGYSKTNKFRLIAEKPPPAATTLIELSNNDGRLPYMHLPTTTIQLIQPQVITLSFPDSTLSGKNNPNDKQIGVAANAIPIQTVKPFIMPKLTPAPATTVSAVSSSTTKPVSTALLPLSTAVITDTVTSTASAATLQPEQQQVPHEPSSASLTPTSQLPIKERLKAILSHGHKTQQAVLAPPTTSANRRIRSADQSGKYDEDSMVRRRAAATRYRNKMRNEHKDLRQRNIELQTENEKLRNCIKQLKQEMSKLQLQLQQQVLVTNGSSGVQAVPAQLQIPPSTLSLVMNIPTMLVPAGGQPSLVQPITYRVEKN